MLNQIIRFRETNIDGCGTDAELMVLLHTDMLLTSGHKERLERAIGEIRIEWDDDDWTTDSVVEEALMRVFGEGVEWEIVLPDFEVEF